MSDLFNRLSQMQKSKIVLFIRGFLGLFLLTLCACAFGAEWKNLSPGLDYVAIQPISDLKSSFVHAFRVDLSHYRLMLAFPSKNQIAGNVEQWTKDHQALLGINGGFFDPQFRSLGLRVDQKTVKSPLKPISWWGVFYIQEGTAHITSQREYLSHKSTDFAIQSGPRLIVNGNIPPLKPGIANRTALGITKSGKIIILATENLPMTTQELAVLMQKPETQEGLDCKDAINLDGGTSTQIYARINQFELDVPGLKNIADAVLLVAR